MLLLLFTFVLLLLFPLRKQFGCIVVYWLCLKHAGLGRHRRWLLPSCLKAKQNTEWKVTVLCLFVLGGDFCIRRQKQGQAPHTIHSSLKTVRAPFIFIFSRYAFISDIVVRCICLMHFCELSKSWKNNTIVHTLHQLQILNLIIKHLK